MRRASDNDDKLRARTFANSVYLPPPERFPYGAYETWRMRTSPLETNAFLNMLDTFLGLLQSNPTTPKH